jgi:TPR repeat protein
MLPEVDHIIAQGAERAQVIAAANLKRAADRGDVDAAFALGVHYLLGRGVKTDFAQALSLLDRAADAGLEDAVYFRDLALEQLEREHANSNVADSIVTLMDAKRREFFPRPSLIEAKR